MARILVVYPGPDGLLRRVAQEIADACEADIDEIPGLPALSGPQDSALSGMARLHARWRWLLGATPPPDQPLRNPAHYDLVVIGTPVRFRRVALPMRRYLRTHAACLREVAFLCTGPRTGLGRGMRSLQRLAGRTPVARLGLSERQIAWRRHGAFLSLFVAQLRPANADLLPPHQEASA